MHVSTTISTPIVLFSTEIRMKIVHLPYCITGDKIWQVWRLLKNMYFLVITFLQRCCVTKPIILLRKGFIVWHFRHFFLRVIGFFLFSHTLSLERGNSLNLRTHFIHERSFEVEIVSQVRCGNRAVYCLTWKKIFFMWISHRKSALLLLMEQLFLFIVFNAKNVYSSFSLLKTIMHWV